MSAMPFRSNRTYTSDETSRRPHLVANAIARADALVTETSGRGVVV
jgi:hypothetical protein